MAQESEGKFYVRDLGAIQKRLESLGAQRSDERVRELNLRFDRPDRALHNAGRVLRLRQDRRTRLTYKDADSMRPGTLSRREVEITVDSFDTTRELLEALGYEVAFIYEKYRTTYELDDMEVVLDELPYGRFVEIEGNADKIGGVAGKLGLKWDAVIRDSYSRLFEQARARRQWQFNDLTFENLKDVRVTAQDLGVQVADWHRP